MRISNPSPRGLLKTLALVCLVNMVCLSAHAVPIIRFLPDLDNPKPHIGETTTLTLLISGLAGSSLGAFDLSVGFDPDLFEFDSLSFGQPDPRFPFIGRQLACPGLPTTCIEYGSVNGFSTQLGQVDLFEVSLAPAGALISEQAAGFSLATLTLRAIAQGSSDITLFPVAFADATGNQIDVDVMNGAVIVPETNTLFLLALGLVVMTGRLARR